MTNRVGDAAQRFLAAEAFEPDQFQIEAIEAIEGGASVVVTAPNRFGENAHC